MVANIIDRRVSGKNKSSTIRKRFIKRTRQAIKDSIKDLVDKRNIADSGETDEISIPAKGVHEPIFNHNSDGERKYILPGNTDKIVGDLIPRKEAGGGKGSNASSGGDGEDDFTFNLSRDEFLDLFFEDLELPDLVKTTLKEVVAIKYERAGFIKAGAPNNLNIIRSMQNAIGRRIALQAPYQEELDELEKELEDKKRNKIEPSYDDIVKRVSLQKSIEEVPFIDDVDIRYNAFEQRPDPVSRAVMFCLMDVSGSMGEEEKTLAKKFFMLLHLFLSRNYEKVDIVFIRHHHEAIECDEEEFFFSRESGGTLVSTCLEEMYKIVSSRYDTSDWNIYAAQASDGDNFSSDSKTCLDALLKILPLVQYFSYIQVGRDTAYNAMMGAYHHKSGSELWNIYKPAAEAHANFVMDQVDEASQIFPVFKKLFKKGGVNVK